MTRESMNVREPHPYKGQIMKLKTSIAHNLMGKIPAGTEYKVEDWWENVSGWSWMISEGNPACLVYGIRSGFAGLPCDDEVVYGKIDRLGVLLHISELEEL